MVALPSAPFYVGAVICLFLGMWATVVSAALGRMTRTEATNAYADSRESAEKVTKILTLRPAASMGLATLRALSMSGYGILFTLALLSDFAELWPVPVIFFGVTLLVLFGFAFVNPLDFGASRHVKIIARAQGWLYALARLFSLVVREKEFTPEEFEQRQEDQLAMMVERVSESAAIEDSERDILESLFDMSNTMVRDVMVPRPDMITISADQSLDKAVSLFTRSGFSRVPVYDKTIDNIVGVAYMKDVVRRTHHRHDAEGVTIGDICRDAFFVPEMKIIDALLREMQNNQVHIALVVDEYGGIAGLVTIEDLVEELVGEIEDEHDRSTPDIEDLGDGSYRVAARASIDDLGDVFDVELSDDDVSTVGGLLTKILGRVPIRESSGEIDGIHLSADRFEGRRRRLSTVIARRVDEEPESEES